MKQELEARLEQDFPFMRKKESLQEQKAGGGIRDLYGAFGCDCGDGWYEVLRGMCAEISAAYEEAGAPVDIVVDQVKEKFGGLRFYYHIEGRESRLQALDFIGGPSLRFRPEDSDLRRKVSDIVEKWEEKSFTVCERCGAPGVLRKDLPWIFTLCDLCYSLRKNK